MARLPLYPFRFEPIFKTNLWGGRRLPAFLHRPPPSDEPIGEAWVLSDVPGNSSRVVNGPFAGATLQELLADHAPRILGKAASANGRFPLLCKFIDACQQLSVQVHPNDEQAHRKHPGGSGKTEAWIILDSNPNTSRVFAGFRPGMTVEQFRQALQDKTTPETLHSFVPAPGDCIFLEAGAVHAIGADLLVFEIQQTSDITYRLYDWDRVEAKTGKPRELHIEDALAVADFARGPCLPVVPVPLAHPEVRRERLVQCRYFALDRIIGNRPFQVGASGECRIIALLSSLGEAKIEWTQGQETLSPGEVLLIPAEVGECTVRPTAEATVVECSIPG